MTHEIQKTMERVTRPGTLLKGVILVGGLVELGRTFADKRQPDVTGVESYYEDEGPSFIFFRGCGENYRAQAPLFHRKLGGYGSLHFDYQVEGIHSQESIDQHVIDVCKEDGDRDRIFVCASMGLMNAMRSLKNPAVRAAIGENRLQAIISRSGMTSRVDLQPGMQSAAHFSTHVPRLKIVGDLWRVHRLHQANIEIPHSSMTAENEVRLHHESSAFMSPRLVMSQYQAIHDSVGWSEGSHSEIVDENPDVRLLQITAEFDGVTDWKSTNASLERSFGLPVETVVDERRPRGSHADDLEFIEPLYEMMMKLSGRHRTMASAARNLVAFSSRSYSFA